MNDLLVVRAKKGDDEAFYQLMTVHKEQLYRIAYAYLKNNDEALEAIQETTFRSYKSINKLKEAGYFKTWLIRILINYCLDRQQKARQTLDLTQQVTIAGQEILFKQLMRYPTRIAIEVEYNEHNSMKIFSLEGLRVADENGEWPGIINGATASHTGENSVTYFLQSNYFNHSKELYLIVDGIRALEKDKLFIQVDLKNEKLVNPPDNKLILEEITINDQEQIKELVFGLQSNDIKKAYFPFSYTFADGAGTEYDSLANMSSTLGQGVYNNRVMYGIGLINYYYDDTVILELTDYPNIIHQEIKLKVKMIEITTT